MRYSAAFGRQETIMYKKFDLEAAKNGAPVISKTGNPVRIICFDRKDDDFPVIALEDDGDGEEYSSYTIDGKLFTTGDSEADLFMAPVKKKGWVNVYPSSEPGLVAKPSLGIYEHKSYADSYATKDRIACIEIEWPE
jgi:hypothetical protein